MRGRTAVRCVGENIFTVVFIYQNQKANEYFVKRTKMEKLHLTE